MTTALIDPLLTPVRKSEKGAAVGSAGPNIRSPTAVPMTRVMKSTPVPIQKSRVRGSLPASTRHLKRLARRSAKREGRATKEPARSRLCPPTFGGARKKRKTAPDCKEERQGCGG